MSDDARRGAAAVLHGWGGAVSSSAEVAPVRSVDALRAVFARARREGRSVALRGTGCSYGDASLNAGGIVVDLTPFRRVLAFDPATGVVDAEPGVTVEDLWRLGLPHGWWPPVVSGTMYPTLGGALGMNIHGKNSFAVGTLGEHVEAFDLLTPQGDVVTCSRDARPELFRAAVGGFGMLGAFVRIRLRLKKVPGGRLKVTVHAPRNLAAMIERFEADRADADYLVGWIDGFARGAALGRGVIHRGDYAGPEDDPEAAATLALDRQALPPRLFGLVPRTWMWRLAVPLVNDLGMRAVNAAKFLSATLAARRKPYLQSHVAFAFLLDYVPNWKRSYGRGGLIQYQSFIPADAAERVHSELIRRSQEAGLIPYLLVYKRHRRDPYLLTHAVDGYSMAMDFRVTASNRGRLWTLCRGFDDVVASAGGRFYFAKDATLTRASFARSVPPAELAAFAALKAELDPDNLLQTDLSRRVFAFAAAPAGRRTGGSTD
ncbi:MAG TPA: FAD-binding oxidoreductase [Planctomycetota bacterium]|nr:FAD-binding oxidoreductase [Planctomycetota bacterium]